MDEEKGKDLVSPAKLLIVEDDLALASLMAAYFETAGFQVRSVDTASAMFLALASQRPDAILLDLELPDEDGFVLVRRLRRTSDIPIVIVTARSDADFRVTGLEIGADDYVTKPFDARELVARVRNILARAGRRSRSGGDVVIDGIALHPEDHLVIDRAGTVVHLTPSESAILAALVRAHGRPLSRDQLLDAGDNLDGPESARSIDITVSRLRRKIERDPRKPTLLITVQGLGYRLNIG